MSTHIKRRVLTSIKQIVLVALVLSLAGCVSMSNGGDPSTSGTSTPQCTFVHEVVEPSGEYVAATETYAYENLSGTAQRAFEKALDRGSYSTTDRSLRSSEFRYWGTTTSYNVTYRNETYKLLTYAGEGCNE